MINAVNLSGRENLINANEKKATKQENTVETTAQQEACVVEIGRVPEKKATYDNPKVLKPDVQKIEQLKKEAEDALSPLRQMVFREQDRSRLLYNIFLHQTGLQTA
ncbi:MAG: hypothetical protein BWY74_04346 [Firmicutes bacterium ADurb.Bin419]|nr:MAG: hypothetical protein BWY74_04346 [Firmicutes bacterium ADurb.Bin419]